MLRRHFLVAPAAAVAAAQAPAQPDTATNPAGLEYFLLGNGKILVGVQWTQTAEAGAQAGLVLMSSEHLNRKNGSLLHHPRMGLQATRLTVVVDGKAYTPEPGRVEMDWQYRQGVPTVRMRWTAGPCQITELLWCAQGDAALIREVEIAGAPTARLLATLRPNPLLFDEYEVNHAPARLAAGGYHRLELSAAAEARALERDIEIRPGGASRACFVLTLDRPGATWDEASVRRAHSAAAAVWAPQARLESGDARLDQMFRMAGHGLRSVVADSGKMDGGPWGYNLEWVRDAVMTAAGNAMAGHPQVGDRLLERVLTRSVSPSGAALDSSVHRPPETIELDQNGQLLCMLWKHWVWTGSDTLIRRHWARIKAVADFPLDPVYRDPGTGLVKNTREFWERSAPHGVREGYESAYQCWNIAGWLRAADMARLMGDAESAARWSAASGLMRRSFLSDPRFSFIRDGRCVKRLLPNGEVQRTLDPPSRTSLPPGMPIATEAVSYCDPDAGSVYPMLLGIVDPAGPVARATLESMETLWNQRWQIGGYGRYNVTGEPDSPGPWPFATLFIARAYAEAGDSAKVRRTLDWLWAVPGGRTGTWFEYYGPRPVPPLPPVAVIPWTWAELVGLVVEQILGVLPDPEGLTVRPRPLDGMNDVQARLLLNGHTLSLKLKRGAGQKAAFVNGREVEFKNGALRTPRPQRATEIEIRL